MPDDQLLLTWDTVTSGFDSGYMVDVALYDFYKAFDVVCHSILLNKLDSIGIGDILLK